MASKKEIFKFLIREFHTKSLPETFPRDMELPVSPRKIISVYGPRRSGKSYYFYTLIRRLLAGRVPQESILYLNFEDDRLLPLAAAELAQFLEAYYELYPDQVHQKKYFFFDEIQNVENWEVFVRRIHDHENVSLFVTGSSSKLLSSEIATSLRGRTLSFALGPLNFKEFLRFHGFEPGRHLLHDPERFRVKKYLDEYLEYGGFPEVALEKNKGVKDKILGEYFESLVYRDLAERHHLENMELLRDMLKFLFTNSASLFSVNSYYKSAKQNFHLSRETVSEYLRHIQETGYFILLPKFSWSLKEQKVNPQKVLCLDLGLRNHMMFRFTKNGGRNAENLVGIRLSQTGGRLYHWHNDSEVDFVAHSGNGFRAVNVTYGSAVPERETKSLSEFKRFNERVKELLLITRDTDEKIGGVRAIPLWRWLLD